MIRMLCLLWAFSAAQLLAQQRADTPRQIASETGSTSFKEVTAQLDPGGVLYAYVATSEWLEGLSQTVSGWRKLVLDIPSLPDDAKPAVNQGFDLASKIIAASGVEQITGFGISSIKRASETYHTKAILHHRRGKDQGLIWSAFGKQAHPFPLLARFSTNTAYALFSEMDLAQVWTLVRDQLNQSGIAPAKEWASNWPAQFSAATGLDFDEALRSLSGEAALVLTLNDAHAVALPLPTPESVEIPEPGLLLLVRTKSPLIFNRIDQEQDDNVIRIDEENLKMRVLPLPVPLAMTVRFTIAQWGEWLVLASNDALVRELVENEKRGVAALTETEEFKRASQGISLEGNHLQFVSRRFSEDVLEMQQKILRANPRTGAEGNWIAALITHVKPAEYFAVSKNTPEGWVMAANGNHSPTKVVLGYTMVLPAGLMAAVAVPNFVKARSTAQRNAIINNLRQLDGAKEQWALENRKRNGAPVTWPDVVPFLRQGKQPEPIAGEIYQLNVVGEPPTATLTKPLGNAPAGAVLKPD